MTQMELNGARLLEAKNPNEIGRVTIILTDDGRPPRVESMFDILTVNMILDQVKLLIAKNTRLGLPQPNETN